MALVRHATAYRYTMKKGSFSGANHIFREEGLGALAKSTKGGLGGGRTP